MSLISRRRGSLGGRLVSLKWRYYWNRDATLAQARFGRRPEGEGARLLADLLRDGIGVSSVEALLGDASLLGELSSAVSQLEQEQQQEIAEARRSADLELEQKAFLYRPLGKQPVFDPQSIYLRIALRPEIVRVVNAYFGLFAELRYFSIWHSLASNAPPRRSQLWHRDREDQRVIKGFIYLSEVDDGHGPFIYGRGTHDRGGLHDEPESFKETGHGNPRSTDEQMAAVLPRERWLQARGEPGTLILADTTGYHRGGLARIGDRLLFTFMFVSPLSTARVGFAPAPSWPAGLYDAEPALAWAARRGRSEAERR